MDDLSLPNLRRHRRLPCYAALSSSSAAQQPSSWCDHDAVDVETTDDGSPFLMSPAPSLLAQMEHPTAERVVIQSLLQTLQVTTTAIQGGKQQPIIEQHVNANAALLASPTGDDHATAVALSNAVDTNDDNRDDVTTTAMSVITSHDVSVPNKQVVVANDDEHEHETDVLSSDRITTTTTIPPQDDNVSTETRNRERRMAGKTTTTSTTTRPTAAKVEWKNPRHARMMRAIRTTKPQEAWEAYQQCIQQGLIVKHKVLVQLFNVIVTSNPVAAHQILKHYHEIAGEPAHEAIYATLCRSIGTVPYDMARKKQFANLVQNVQQDLLQLDMTYQRRCLPILLGSLVQQPMRYIGRRMAAGLYQYMVEQNMTLSYGHMCHILYVSSLSRRQDLSFPTILQRLVKEGHRPPPSVAIHVLQNLFPFTNVNETIVTMKAIVELQSSLGEIEDEHRQEYCVDIGTLEHIMMAAARVGSFELNILVWDLVDLLGYEPTEGMYECTIQGFVMGVRQDHNVFVVMREMEDCGLVPSRALIRGLSRSLRFSDRRVGFARKLLTTSTEVGARKSVSSLNTILSAASELGDVDLVFSIFDDFALYDIEPNVDSYSFLLEALALSVSPSKQKDEAQRKADAPSRLDAASGILSLMEETGIPPCQYCTEKYAQLLYNVGRLDAANEFVLDSLARGDPVNNRILTILSKQNAMEGNIETARLLASKMSEHIGHLERRIAEREKSLSKDDRSMMRDRSEANEYSRQSTTSDTKF